MTVEIRRRTALVATIAILAALLAAGYLWRFAVAGGSVLLVVGSALGAVAGAYGVALWGARSPLLLADVTGLRVRLGTGWVGVPWEAVHRVGVGVRGQVRDGRVVVLPSDEADALGNAGLCSRLAAAWNRRLYGHALVVPYGLATRVSVDDLTGHLQLLADGRAKVAVLGGPNPSEIVADSAVAGAGTAMPVSPPPLRPLPSAVQAPAARREEVTIAVRHEAVHGMLALSAPADDVLTEELPEIAELRRGTERTEGDVVPAVGGNVGLIIDATTDLSARAMRKVRRGPAEPELRADAQAPPELRADAQAPPEQADGPRVLYLGAVLREARENLGMTVDDLADRTRIRPFVIECMESDDFSPCGGDFYARGHLRMLARVLGIASEPLIATYDEHFTSDPVSLRAVFDAELSAGTTGMVRGGASGATWGGLVAAVVILVLIWAVAKYVTGA